MNPIPEAGRRFIRHFYFSIFDLPLPPIFHWRAPAGGASALISFADKEVRERRKGVTGLGRRTFAGLDENDFHVAAPVLSIAVGVRGAAGISWRFIVEFISICSIFKQTFLLKKINILLIPTFFGRFPRCGGNVRAVQIASFLPFNRIGKGSMPWVIV